MLDYIRYWQASGESIKTSVRVKTRISQLTEEGYYTGGKVPYQDLRAETIRVIQGTSRLNVDLLNSIVAETTAQIKELEQQIKTAETELHELTHGAEQARQDYTQLMNWAALYDRVILLASYLSVR